MSLGEKEDGGVADGISASMLLLLFRRELLCREAEGGKALACRFLAEVPPVEISWCEAATPAGRMICETCCCCCLIIGLLEVPGLDSLTIEEDPMP